MGNTSKNMSQWQPNELVLISTIAHTANVAMQTDDFLPAVAAGIRHSLQWDRVVIGLLQVDNITLHIVVDQPKEAGSELEEQYANPTDFALILDVLNAGHTNILHRDDPALIGTHTSTILQEANLQTVQSVVLRSDDQLLGALVVGSTNPRDVSDQETNLLETICDIISTAIGRIYKYEELNQANRLKSAFLATVTHELRSPITSVIGYTQMMQRGRFGTLPEVTAEPLEFIIHSSKRILNLVNDLLDFSKIEAGHLSVEITTIELAPILRNTIRMIMPQVQERGLELHTNIEENLPPVRASNERLEQVIINLLSNAVKFTEKGAVTVSVKHLDEHYIRISVQDTGVGITPEHQALIFGEYQQIKNQANLSFAGTGLGLAISKRLIQLMGGDMSLESTPGIGSTFHCDIRIATHSRAKPEQSEE